MNTRSNCISCDNKSCFLFENCTLDWHERIGNSKTCSQVKKNVQILYEGEPINGLFFIKSGRVKVFKDTNYRGQIVRISGPGDILGRGLVKEGGYSVSASTMEDCQICFIAQDTFVELLNNNPSLSIKMMHFYAEELQKTENRLRNMAIMTVRERVADAILMIYNSLIRCPNQNIINSSRKEIAEIAGTYAEQVSRYITEFKNEEILNLKGKNIILLQPKTLQKMIEHYN